MFQIVFTDMFDVHRFVALVLIFDVYGITFSYIKKLCCFFADNDAVVGQCVFFSGFPVMEVHVMRCFFRCGRKDAFVGFSLDPRVVDQGEALHFHIHIPFHPIFFAEDLVQAFPLLVCDVFIQIDAGVIELNLLVLQSGDLIAGVFESKAHEHERHAAPDPENGHEETFFVAHQIPDGGFPGEIQVIPQNANAF